MHYFSLWYLEKTNRYTHRWLCATVFGVTQCNAINARRRFHSLVTHMARRFKVHTYYVLVLPLCTHTHTTHANTQSLAVSRDVRSVDSISYEIVSFLFFFCFFVREIFVFAKLCMYDWSAQNNTRLIGILATYVYMRRYATFDKVNVIYRQIAADSHNCLYAGSHCYFIE